MKLLLRSFCVLLLLVDVAAAETIDPPELVERHERGVRLFADGQYAAAAYELEQVAAQSQDPARRAAAAELLATARARSIQAPGAIEPAPPPPPPLRVEGPPPGPDGRMRLVWGSAAAGIYYGSALPIILNLTEPHHFTGAILLGTGAGFLVPYLLTQDATVTHGMATLTLSGMAMGAVHGGLLYALLSGTEVGSERLLLTTMMLTSLGEGIAGYVWARDTNMGGGQAGLIAAGSLFGLGWGVGSAFLLLPDPAAVSPRVWAGLALGGSVGGALAGKHLSDRNRYTFGDATILSMGGFAGIYLGFVPPALFDSDSPRFWVGSLMAGSALGLIVGDRLVANKDFSWVQAQYVGLGYTGGALTGAGLGALLSGRDISGRAVLTASALGGVLGYALFALRMDALPDGADAEWAGRITVAPFVGTNGERGVGLAGIF